MPDETPVTVVEGPKGKSEIIEVWSGGRLIEYQVRFNGQTETCTNLGEAYILAGEKAGKRV